MLSFKPGDLVPPPLMLPGEHSVLLDFDGTLVDLVDRPDAVVVDQALGALIKKLTRTFRGRVAVVSGRSVAQLDGFLGEILADVAVVGSHGAEVRAGIYREQPERPESLVAAEGAIRAMFERQDGVVVEAKSLGVAVHYRLAPESEQAARALIDRLAKDTGLTVQEGKMMIELRTAGHDKGTGIKTLMKNARFAGSIPIFAGDDVTDEAGFVAAQSLGGIGVLVGPARQTAARCHLDDVAAVRAWLGQSV